MQRRGFTLVELLVVIAILATLASMMLFALAGAEGDAKIIRTRSTIEKIDAIIMRKWDSYRTRRVPVRAFTAETITNTGYHDINSNGVRDDYRPAAIIFHRLTALREYMRLDMPDRMTDLQDGPQTAVIIGHPTDKMPAPSTWHVYRRFIPTGLSNDSYQGAECLYLIVAKGSDDPEAMESFSPSEIGDKDNDGMKEFWDGWQNPISFLRWAPGYQSSLQDTTAPIDEHDPFDPRQIHTPNNTSDPWYVAPPNKGKHPPLYPLIYSAGPDGEYGIVTDSKSSPIRYAFPPNTNPPILPNNPYYFDGTDRVGTQEAGSEDNVTNHD